MDQKEILESEVSDLARSLDCLTEADFGRLTGTTPLTREAWRKRGTGPGFVRLGNRVYYPRAAVKEFIESKLRPPRVDKRFGGEL